MTEFKIAEFKLPIQNEYILSLPVGSKILSVAEKNDELVVYAMIIETTETMSKMDVTIILKETGGVISTNTKYIGSVKLYKNKITFHVFIEE
jgi:hypothetical protein